VPVVVQTSLCQPRQRRLSGAVSSAFTAAAAPAGEEVMARWMLAGRSAALFASPPPLFSSVPSFFRTEQQ